MKKIAVLMVLALVLMVVMPQLTQAKEPEKKVIYALSRNLVAPNVLDNITVKVKKLKNGVRISMKSKDVERLQAVKSTIEQCIKEAAALTSDANYPQELLYRKGVTSVVTDVKGGFELEMTSDNEELVKLLKEVYLPIKKKPRRMISEPDTPTAGNYEGY